MDKIVHGLEPNKSYKIRYRAVYNDDRKSAPTIAYTVTTPGAPTPPEVDQDTITVDSQSFKDGIIISWTAPDPDDTKPAVADYFVQVTDDLDDWEKFDAVTTETKTIFSEQDQLVSFGTLVPVIYIRVITRSINKLFSTPDSYKEYEFAAETGLRPPDIVTALGLNYSWRVSWSYVPSRPDIVTGYKIYDGETFVANISNATTNSYTRPPDLTIGGQIKTIGVSAVDAEGNESAIRYASPFVVSEIILDIDPPPQRENINFSADTDSADVICTWTNTNLAGDEELNDDLAGVTIRYARTDDATNYFWVDIPFSYSDNRTTATITNLIPNTSYRFQLSTFDTLFNRTEYSTVVTVTTGRDTVPPPKPCPPSVAAGNSAGGPMMIRVQQFAREPLISDPNSTNGDPTKPLPFDTAFFQIWMLNSGQSTSPTGVTNPNAVQIGTLVAGFNGIETQTIIYNSTLATGQTRYFYTRPVDTSGNIGEASVAKLSSEMVVFGDAHIDNLSARKITTDSLNASTIITVGSGTGSIKIDGTGKLYSGLGTYNNQSTGFYLDNSGNFSLKDRLTFDGTTLSVTGNITAQSGFFTGNVGVSTGALYAGGVTAPAQSGGALNRVQNSQIVIAPDGIAAKDGSGATTFALLTSGTALFSGEISAGRAVLNSNVANPEGIGARKYNTGLSFVTQDASTYPTLESRFNSTTGGSGNIGLYRTSGGTRNGVYFYSQGGDGGSNFDAWLRGSIEHGSSGGQGFEAGGVFKIASYGSSTNVTEGKLRLEAYNGASSGKIFISAPLVYLYNGSGKNDRYGNSFAGQTNIDILAVDTAGLIGRKPLSEILGDEALSYSGGFGINVTAQRVIQNTGYRREGTSPSGGNVITYAALSANESPPSGTSVNAGDIFIEY